ncbi:MAG: DUF3391 domain-containing protein [Gammaproteobacteria bacterium]
MKLIVSPIDLRKGMYVSELDRPWLETAFPFQGFRITTSDEIDQISSLCDFVFVDTEKSTVPVPEPRAARNGGAGQETEQVTARIIKLAKPYRNNFEDEYPIAKGVYQKAQIMLGELLNDARVGKSLDIKEAQRLLGMGALIHDIGETKLPDKLLTDSDDLSDEDRALLQSHTRIGKIIVDKLAGVSDRVTAIIRDHHERANGSGYPRKLVNSQVNICTRIVSIVDTYDSLTSGTHGREKIPVDVALKYIYSWRGNLFDALLVEKFIQCIGIYPIGSAVELGSGHIAMVISSLPKARLFPTVLLILDPEGVPLERPKMMNLALFKNEGDDDNHYEVKRLVDPQAYHIDMRGVVLRELGGA